MNKEQLINQYFRNEITCQELNKITKDMFDCEVATIDELKFFISSGFMQAVMEQEYGISAKILVNKVQELIQYMEATK
jgi:hypothetical protein